MLDGKDMASCTLAKEISKVIEAHTADPWIVREATVLDNRVYWIVETKSGTWTVAGNVLHKPDAYLMAAAPTMYRYITDKASQGDAKAKAIISDISTLLAD